MSRLRIRPFVRPWRRPRRDGEPVPRVDGRRDEGEIGYFPVAEMLLCFGEYLVRHVRLRDESDRLDPREARAFAIRKERRLAPRVERIEPLLGLALRARVDRVHVDAERAAVDLRGAQLQEVDELVIEPAGGD